MSGKHTKKITIFPPSGKYESYPSFHRDGITRRKQNCCVEFTRSFEHKKKQETDDNFAKNISYLWQQNRTL